MLRQKKSDRLLDWITHDVGFRYLSFLIWFCFSHTLFLNVRIGTYSNLTQEIHEVLEDARFNIIPETFF